MRARIAIIAALLGLMLPGAAAAQTAPEQASSAAGKPATSAAAEATLSASDAADSALQRARALGEVEAASIAHEAIARFLKREEPNFEALLQRYLNASAAALAEIQDIELRQARETAAIGLSAVREQRRALGARVAALSRAGGELEALRDEWKRRIGAERDRGAPPALLERIDALLKAIDESFDTLRRRGQALLEFDNRLLALEDRYAQVVGRLEAAQRASQRLLLKLAEPPLWMVLRSEDRAQEIGAKALREQWGQWSRSAKQFWQNYSDRVVLHAVVLVLLLGAMAAMSYSAAFRALEAQSGSVRVLQRPVSSALVVAILLSPFIYPGLPAVVGSGLRLVSLVPVWRLIPTFVQAAWRPLFYQVTALFALEAVFLVLPEASGMSRMVMLVISAAALWVTTVALRTPFADAAFSGRRWAGLLRFARRAVALLLAAAIVANLVGATRLSLTLNISIVAPAYLGIGIAAAVFVLEDFVRLLLHAKGAQALRAVMLHRPTILARCATLIRWLAAGLWLWLVLRLLDIGPQIFGAIAAALGATMTLGTFQLSLGGILLFLLAVWIAVLAARFVAFVLDNDVLPRMRLARGLPATISTTARYLIIGLGLLIAASMAGIDLTKITLILGALSVGIGFGLQNVVNNFISGIILLFERPIQVGDTVQVGNLLGVVRGIGIRASNVRTYSGAEVIVPNSELVSGQVINWTLSDRYRRLELDVGVAYGNRPADVIRVLEAVLEKHEGALKSPAPFVRFRGFGDSSLDFRLYVWVDYDEGLLQTSAVLSAVYDALAEAGIEIPFPQRDLHLRSVSDKASQALRGENP